MNEIKVQGHHLQVDVSEQKLTHYNDGAIIKTYPVSTASNGIGCEKGSFKTPIGWHKIRAKIGGGCAAGTIFKARRPIKGRFMPQMLKDQPGSDWILSRILWLSGMEPGLNRLGAFDSMQRYIYIHGMGDESKIGQPCSKGCINMLNDDIIELFDIIPTGTTVYIRG